MRTSRPQFSLRLFLGGFALLALVSFAYRPLLASGAGFIWDDDQYVAENPLLEEAGGLRRVWTEPKASPQYYPLVFTSFWLERAAFGESPRGHHLGNLLLQSMAAILLWLCAARIGVPGAWLGAALFALHPLQVESVAWITERKNLLSMVLALGATRAWLHFRTPGGDFQTSGRRWGGYALALLLFASALTAKTVVSTAPAVWLLILWGRRSLRPRDVVLLLPFIWLGLQQGLMTARLEVEHVGARGAEWDYGFLERLLIAGRGLCFYASKFLLPIDLSFNYPRVLPDPQRAIAWLPLIGPIVLLGGTLLRSPRWGRGPFVLAAAFCGSLFPALGFFDVYPFRYSFVADHFAYHALAFAALAAGALLAGRRRGGGRIVLAIVLLTLFTALTARRAEVFRDRELLWRDTLEVHPESGIALHNLGILRLQAGDLKEAMSLLIEAEKTGLDRHQVVRHQSIVLSQLGMRLEALALAELAQALAPDDPDTLTTRGAAELEVNGHEAAMEYIDRALAIEPDHALAHEKRAVVLFLRDRFHEARASALRATELAPRSAGAWNALGLVEGRLGAEDRARRALEKAAALAPHLVEVQINLAQLDLKSGKAQRALDRLKSLPPELGQFDEIRLLLARAEWQSEPAKEPRLLGALLQDDRAGPKIRRAARRLLVRGFLERGDFERALIEARHPAPESDRESEWDRRRCEAQVLWEAGRREEARQLFEVTLGPSRLAQMDKSGMDAAFRAFARITQGASNDETQR
jgi:protein O-mannosyl-transferase